MSESVVQRARPKVKKVARSRDFFVHVPYPYKGYEEIRDFFQQRNLYEKSHVYISDVAPDVLEFLDIDASRTRVLYVHITNQIMDKRFQDRVLVDFPQCTIKGLPSHLDAKQKKTLKARLRRTVSTKSDKSKRTRSHELMEEEESKEKGMGSRKSLKKEDSMWGTKHDQLFELVHTLNVTVNNFVQSVTIQQNHIEQQQQQQQNLTKTTVPSIDMMAANPNPNSNVNVKEPQFVPPHLSMSNSTPLTSNSSRSRSDTSSPTKLFKTEERNHHLKLNQIPLQTIDSTITSKLFDEENHNNKIDKYLRQELYEMAREPRSTFDTFVKKIAETQHFDFVDTLVENDEMYRKKFNYIHKLFARPFN